ncbi:TolB family protein [candidate division KSB1 bacterium]
MKQIISAGLLLLLVVSCSKDEGDPNVFKFDKSDFIPLHLVEGAIDPAWSPDGATIVFAYMDNLWTIPVEGAEEPTQITTMGGRELYSAWAPGAATNKLVFINSTSQEANTIYTLTPGGEPEEVAAFTEQIIQTSWSSDGSKIIFLRLGKKAIYTIPAEGGEVAEITNSLGWGNTMILAQAGRAENTVIFVDIEKTTYRINQIDINGGESENIILFPPGQALDAPYSIDISYGGDNIAYTTEIDIGGGDAGYSLILVPYPYIGGGTIPLFPGWQFWRINNPSWAPDGTQLALETPDGLYRVVLKL